MISHEKKCIFVEIPKTGSTSVRAVLGSPPRPHLNICQIKHEMMQSWTRYGGRKNRLLAGLYLLLEEQKRARIGLRRFESYFKFGFVRNPWDRVVSLYRRREGLQLREKMTFTEFVSWIRYSSSTSIHATPHVNQLDWLVDPHGELLVDFVGRFENLAQDWAKIASRLELPARLEHKNRNPMQQKHYTEFYDKRTREIIADRFRVDIEYFGYRFDR